MVDLVFMMLVRKASSLICVTLDNIYLWLLTPGYSHLLSATHRTPKLSTGSTFSCGPASATVGVWGNKSEDRLCFSVCLPEPNESN